MYQLVYSRHQMLVVLLQQREQFPLVDKGHVQVGLDQLRRMNQRLLDLVDQLRLVLMDELRNVKQRFMDIDQRLMDYLRNMEDWLMNNMLQWLDDVYDWLVDDWMWQDVVQFVQQVGLSVDGASDLLDHSVEPVLGVRCIFDDPDRSVGFYKGIFT